MWMWLRRKKWDDLYSREPQGREFKKRNNTGEIALCTYMGGFGSGGSRHYNPDRASAARVAIRGGWFWLPCPSCGEPFGGQEWTHDAFGHESSIPNGRPGGGKGICPLCTAKGIGCKAMYAKGEFIHADCEFIDWVEPELTGPDKIKAAIKADRGGDAPPQIQGFA